MDPQQATQVVQAVHTGVVTVQPFVLQLIVVAKAIIIPLMLALFFVHVPLRALIYYTVRRNDMFAQEFEKRLNRFFTEDGHQGARSFYVTAKRLLEKTYYEMFENRAMYKRRRLDHIMAPSDRIFLIQQGTAYLVRDTLKEVKFMKYDGNRPPLLESVKSILAGNPCFNRALGILPVQAFNDMLNIVPGLFIIAGIFGTFLGLMQALPELGAMDIRDPESTKLVMDTFLAKIAYSMTSSTIGIFLSVTTTVYNNFLSPERVFLRVVDRLERNLHRLWARCDNNKLPEQIPDFDEHKDPVEALAALSVDKQIKAKDLAGKDDSKEAARQTAA